MSNIKFGAVPTQAGISWDELLAVWQELDRSSGFESLWLMDHFVTGFGVEFGSEGPCTEGWTSLAALAHATSRVRLGILVTGNTYRHPAVLAKMATTVDHISGGRLEFGIGAAWHTYEHQAFAIPFHTVRERLQRLDEAVQVIKLLWTQARPAFNGRHYQLDRPPYNPPNVQQPHPPILIGGGGEKRTLRTVAKYADATNVQGTPEEVARKFQVLEGHCKEIGRDFGSIRRTIQVPLFLTEDAAFRQRVLQGMSAATGRPPEEAARGLLIGSVDEIKERVREFVAAGVQEFMLAQWPRIHMESLRRFSEEVIPEFK
ncbi:MAG: LLM class F420-dependent oxidoreductase [Dehalococcoidia bacterium]|nr:LLM class F420-dependent oxidoreductase [Dehalococcoidia bacterium]